MYKIIKNRLRHSKKFDFSLGIQSLDIRHSRAFTLIEMLISISVFMLFLGIVAQSYMSLVTANRKANDIQKMYREVRFVFDTLAQEIRNGAIDYTCGDPIQHNTLCISHPKNGEQFLYKFADKKLLVKRDAGGFQPVTSDNLKIDDMSFTVFPEQNPYAQTAAGNDAVQWQPSVRIELKTSGYDFKTTYSSRAYGRKTLYK